MKIGNTISTFALAALMAFPSFGAAVAEPKTDLDAKVRQAVNTLPNYGVFDNLTFDVKDGVVTLGGQVRTYVVRNQAVSALKNVPGVVKVQDNIEILPLSRFDDDIRIRTYNAIFGDPAMTRYVFRGLSPIRILVKNGEVTIYGSVLNDFDRKLIMAKAQGVRNALKVTNALQLDSD